MAREAGAIPAPARVLPRWEGLDVLALSFVFGLPPLALFSTLRGEQGEEGAEQEGTLRLPAGDVTADDPLDALLQTLGVEEAALIGATARKEASLALTRAHASSTEAVPWLTPRYPPRVAGIFDPPLVLWVRGSVDVLSEASVAIVGSRAASVYGEETAARLAGDLARRGFVIVSGMARGVDAAAHRGALAAGGRTVAVLGCGADVVYPPEHGDLATEVIRHGAVVSELPPGTLPLPFHFPRRNRIISALSLGVVVVEARQRSGALITADCALEQGREVMAVPGSVLSERHRGSHTLLKAGAALVETAEDVLQVIRGAGALPPGGSRDPLLAIMDAGESYEFDALARASGRDASSLLTRLLELELQGLVRRAPGGRFVRSPGTC
jgi:DNA processing protein